MGVADQVGTAVPAQDAVINIVRQLDDFKKARIQRCPDGIRVSVVAGEADMADPPFPDGSFDLVWSEGAVYLMGFDAALRAKMGEAAVSAAVAAEDA